MPQDACADEEVNQWRVKICPHLVQFIKIVACGIHIISHFRKLIFSHLGHVLKVSHTLSHMPHNFFFFWKLLTFLFASILVLFNFKAWAYIQTQ